MPTILGRVKGFPTGTAEWDGRRLVRTYDDRWQVQADNESQGPKEIIESVGVSVGDQFFDDLFALAKKAGPTSRSKGNRLIWEVPIFYTTQFPQVDADDLNKAPTERRVKRRWSFETEEVAITADAITGDPFVNKVGQPLEETTELTIPVLTIERYELAFSPTTILNYVNHTNSGAFYGAPAKTAAMAGIEAEEDAAEVYEGVLYDRVRYVIKFRIPVTEENKGWVVRILNMGTVHRDPDNADLLVPYLSDEETTTALRTQITGPLDIDGGRNPDGSPVVFLEFNKKKLADFDTLLIGPTA